MTYEEARRLDPTVARCHECELSSADTIARLVEDKQRLIQMVQRLQLYCPRKIEVAGQTWVWHCPDHLVPPQEEILKCLT